ncbi:MAG: ABC transporter permease [Candidatus Bipolaricaulia bacterium]
MWLILRLAVRNLFRNRRRSVLTLMAIMVPVLLLNLMWGFTGAFEQSLFENTVRLETGHLQIHKADYEVVGQAAPIVRDIRPAVDVLASDDDIKHYATRLALPALASAGNQSKGVLVQGVQPKRSQRMSVMSRWVDQGRYLQSDDSGVAVVGRQLLEDLELTVGDRLILVTSHPETGTGVLTPTIVGVLDAPSPELSQRIVQVPLAEAQSAISLPNAATSVAALVKGVNGPWDSPRIEQVTERVRQALGEGFAVESWRSLAPQTVGLLNILKPINLGIMSIFFLLAGLVVINTLFLNVHERTNELGVVLALGSGRRRVLGMVVAEAAMIALIGALIGSAIGGGLVWHWSDGLVLPDIYRDVYRQIGMQPVLNLHMTISQGLISAAAMLGIALLASWLPARNAAALEPIEAMRGA